jgi:hypothetical protein
MRNVASYCAITGEIVNIADAYASTSELDFSGTRNSTAPGLPLASFLTVPLKNHNGFVHRRAAVDQRQGPAGRVIPFDDRSCRWSARWPRRPRCRSTTAT